MTAYTLQLLAPQATTDTSLPKLLQDSILNTGSIFLYDFLRLASWNPLVNTAVDGAAVGNLVPGGPSAMLKIPAAGNLAFVSNGFQLGSSLGLGRIQLDPGTNYFQSNLTHDFLITMWATYPATDPGGHIGQLLTKDPSSASYFQQGPFFAHRYSSGGDGAAHMDFAASNGTSFTSMGSPVGKQQYAIAKVGANTQIYHNGVLFYSAATGTPALSATFSPMNFGNGPATGMYAAPGVILHRTYCEDLTISGLTAAAQVAADYSYNSTRFS